MTPSDHLETLRALRVTAFCSFTAGELDALTWAVAEITRLNSRNHTLEAQSQRMADLIEDMRQTLRETREGPAVDPLTEYVEAVKADIREAAKLKREVAVAADLREATEGHVPTEEEQIIERIRKTPWPEVPEGCNREAHPKTNLP